jgi:hypothetical protein
MKVAHELIELKELISQLGLKDGKREFPRYKVDIPGNYYIEQGSLRGFRYTCRLVDVSKGGVSIKIEKVTFHLGEILHLQFSAGLNMTDAVGKVVYIDREDDGYKVGLQSLSEKVDIINQLFNE